MPFELRFPLRVLFGEGTFEALGEAVASYGRRALLVTGQRAMQQTGRLAQAQDLLRRAGVENVIYAEITPNPTCEIVDRGAELARAEGCDVIVGLGGGSSLDAAKAIAVAAAHRRPIREFIVGTEGGNPQPPTAATWPIICVTSTAGTSSELTPFAVITVPELRQKSAIRSLFIVPKVAIEDPELTYSAPPEVTAATGIDVLCHALEAFISVKATPPTDLWAQEAIRLVGIYLPRAYENGQEVEARRQMMLANMYAGFALAACGATIMHALEHPISAHHPEIAHGLGLAVLLRAWAELFWPQWPERFVRVAELLGVGVQGQPLAQAAQQAALALAGLLESVGLVQRLRDLGVKAEELPILAADANRYMAGAVQNTPGAPDEALLRALLERAY